MSTKKDRFRRNSPDILPIIHLLGICKDILKSVDKGNKVAEVAGPVVKNKVDGHFIADNNDIIAVFILLYNRLLINSTDAGNKYLGRNNRKKSNSSGNSSCYGTDI